MLLPAENYKLILENIKQAAYRSGRNPAAVKMIAVTKYVGLAEVNKAAALGLKDFGENRVQEAASKVGQRPDLNWHFIGHLQSNKVKEVLPHYILIHSLDRLSLATALQRCAERFGQMAETLVQVNTSGEKSKFGLSPEELPGFLDEIRTFDRIKVNGLMTMAPFVDDPEEARPCFSLLRILRDQNAEIGRELTELSMGMTNDYPVAIEEGATIIRIGSALFN